MQLHAKARSTAFRTGPALARGHWPLALRRHKQSAGTACVRLQPAKPARHDDVLAGPTSKHRRPLGGPAKVLLGRGASFQP